MKRPNVAPPDHVLTPEEQRDRIERLLLDRCKELKKQRLERTRINEAIEKKKKQTPKLLRRCLTCGAYKFLIAARKRTK